MNSSTAGGNIRLYAGSTIPADQSNPVSPLASLPQTGTATGPGVTTGTTTFNLAAGSAYIVDVWGDTSGQSNNVAMTNVWQLTQ